MGQVHGSATTTEAVVERYNWGSEARKLVELYSGL